MATRKIKLPPDGAPSVDYFAPEILGELRDISDKLDSVIRELDAVVRALHSAAPGGSRTMRIR